MNSNSVARLVNDHESVFLFAFEGGVKGVPFFTDPYEVIQADTPAEVVRAFRRIQKYSRRYYLAGFLSYELGYAFDGYFKQSPAAGFPLLYFGVFKKPRVFDRRSIFTVGDDELKKTGISSVCLSRSKQDYYRCIHRIQEYIREGDIYQANFCMQYRFRVSADPFYLFRRLWLRQPVPYGAYVKTPKATILSFSPELFFKKTGDRIVCRPMKGTMSRGTFARQDKRLRNALHTDGKNRAENLMIVDLVRNDLSRIARPYSVKVDSLFTVEKYRTLFQMVSQVRASIRRSVPYYGLFRALFPCGSITGTPKLRAMRILADLEHVPRRVYCGSIGMIRPDGCATFNVAIRTALLEGGRGEFGVGGGITADSNAEEEYHECLLKGDFFTRMIR